MGDRQVTLHYKPYQKRSSPGTWKDCFIVWLSLVSHLRPSCVKAGHCFYKWELYPTHFVGRLSASHTDLTAQLYKLVIKRLNLSNLVLVTRFTWKCRVGLWLTRLQYSIFGWWVTHQLDKLDKNKLHTRMLDDSDGWLSLIRRQLGV